MYPLPTEHFANSKEPQIQKKSQSQTDVSKKLPIITDVQIVEGIVASSIFVVFVHIMRFKMRLSYWWYLTLPWFFTWIFRKAIPNLYVFIKTNYLNMKPTYTYYF